MTSDQKERAGTTKLCLFCKHFYLYHATQGYSEYTPGSDAEMGCNKNIIEINLNGDTLEDYRNKILTAERCKEYVSEL